MNVSEGALRIYRDRVSGAAYFLRWSGAVLIVAGLACAIANLQRFGRHGTPLEIAGLVMVVIGWALIAVAFRSRSPYHRRRNPGV